MRKPKSTQGWILLCSLLLVACLLSAGRTFADDATWAIVSTRPLDPRIENQIHEIAGQSQASLAIVRSRRAASTLHPSLILELDLASNAIAFGRSLTRATNSSRAVPKTSREGYILNLTYRDASRLSDIRVEAARPEGFHNALLRLPVLLSLEPAGLNSGLFPPPKTVRLHKSGRSASAVVADFPSFLARGVVEGFYGTPWSHQDRLDILRFEGQHGMNVYYYAPKDDPYHRRQWRDPYPADNRQQLAELVQAARASFVDFCFALSPGLSMTYSSKADFAKLTAKFDSVVGLGVSCFALFLDDVPEELQNVQDKVRFKSLGRAHAQLINQLYRHLRSRSPQNQLTVTPTTYTNAQGGRDYIREIGARVNPRVNLMWTGTEIVSPEITVAEAREWGKFLHRPPLVWDNFPVNDGIPWRLVLGPMRSRDPALDKATRGLVANPMNQAHASMLPLETVAEYLWNPPAYQADDAEWRAVEDQYGKEAFELLRPILEPYGDYWWQDNIFKPLWVETRLPIDLSAINRSLVSIESSINEMKSRASFEKLVPEISPFAESTRQRAEALAADPAFRSVADGRVSWNEDYDTLVAGRVDMPPALDGDFAKWETGSLYRLDDATPLVSGASAWKGPEQFSARFGLAWDDHYLYLGLDVVDRDIYQPPAGVDIRKGDMVRVYIETTFRQNYYARTAGADAFPLLASPGNFNGVGPSLVIGKNPLPPRLANYRQEIKAVWRKTDRGYSGDIAIPAAYFDERLHEGYEAGLVIFAQKAPPSVSAATDPQEFQPIRFSSKRDRLFPAAFNNPATYQRLVLAGTAHP